MNEQIVHMHSNFWSLDIFNAAVLTLPGGGLAPSQGMGRVPVCWMAIACCIFATSASIIFCSSSRNFL